MARTIRTANLGSVLYMGNSNQDRKVIPDHQEGKDPKDDDDKETRIIADNQQRSIVTVNIMLRQSRPCDWFLP